MSKWQWSEAAQKRVEKDVRKRCYDAQDYGTHAVWDHVVAAVHAEGFDQRTERRASELVLSWVREADTQMAAYAAACVDRWFFDRVELRSAGRTIMSALESFKDQRLGE